MEGYGSFFHVRVGNPVLKHPLYLKYNIRSLDYIKQNMDTELANDLKAIMATNDNMAIIWYLTSLMRTIGGF